MTAEATPARSSERKPDAPGAVAATTSASVGDAAILPGWTPAGRIHRLRPPQVNALQSAAGNGAVGRLLGSDRSGIQRAPARPAKAATPTRSVDSYVDLLNAFQDLAAAYINKGGAGLGQVKFGKDLNSAHRSLLWGVRRTLSQAVEKDPDNRKKASAGWRYLSAKLLAAVEEARTLGLPTDALAAVSDQIAMINKRLGRTRRRADVPEEESVDSYNDVLRAVRDLLWEGTRLREGYIGLQREEVPGRKDVEVSASLRELNQKHRDLIAKVQLGRHLIGRHKTLLEKLRSTLLAAHSEAPGSAFKALQQWRSIEGELRYVLQRAATFGEGEIDIGPLLKLMDEVAAKLAQHYSAVHQENLQGLLSKQRAVGDVKTRKKVAEAVGGKAAVAAMQEAISIEDVENGLRVIQHGLSPSQEHPGEWIIRNGPTVMRIREDQALGLRAAAAQALTQYMQSLVSALVGAQIDYENIKRGTSKFKRRVLGFMGGADDPGDFSTEVRRLFLLRDKSIKPLVEAGQFVEAFKIIIREKPGVEARVKAEHEYDMDLDKGYRRLATTMQVVQVALVSLVPIAGEAALAGGAAAWAVGGTAVASGAGGAMLGETGRQVYTGEYDAGKVLSAGRQGAVIGASAVAPAVTRSAGGGISRTLGTSEAFGEYSASIVVGGTQSTLGGGSFTEGAMGGGLGWGTGKATSPLGQGFTGKLAQTTAGAGVAAVTGQDPLAGATGALVGSFAKPPPTPSKPTPTGKPSPTTGGSETIPGTGIAPRTPAAPTPTGGTDTIPGTGIAPRTPAVP
ncbi:MAG: hypothetical protein FIA92_13200, partial [Chloroflexi bacterium]|nr:hypothetical protein [Chloroflexota bacterium]